ncbi:MAG: hypothetical protein V1782_03055 [Pseudomonadota bacterium]
MIQSFIVICNRGATVVQLCLRLAALAMLLLPPFPAMAEEDRAEASQAVTASYLHHLGNFTGTIPFEWVPITIDEARQEVYVLNPAEHTVNIFNESGLEVYRFDTDERLGNIGGVAVLEDGDILLLCYPQRGGKAIPVRCDYRGDVREEFALTELPSAPGGFRPDQMVLRQGRLYLAETDDMRVAVFDLRGKYLEHFDLVKLLGLTIKDGAPVNVGMGGFDVDQDGALLFTVPTNFHGYRLRPGHELEEFGRAGGAPGRFNVVGGIVAGPDGLIFVTDTLKAAVLVFDRNFNFLSEFGYRGSHPESLIGPLNLAVSQRGRLYVTQLGKQGVKVFRFTVKPVQPREPVKPAKPGEGGK